MSWQVEEADGTPIDSAIGNLKETLAAWCPTPHEGLEEAADFIVKPVSRRHGRIGWLSARNGFKVIAWPEDGVANGGRGRMPPLPTSDPNMSTGIVDLSKSSDDLRGNSQG